MTLFLIADNYILEKHFELDRHLLEERTVIIDDITEKANYLHNSNQICDCKIKATGY